MIVKQRYFYGGWRWLDNVETVEQAGWVQASDLNLVPGEGSPLRPARVFQSEDDVQEFVTQVYGPAAHREFVVEWLPAFASDNDSMTEGMFQSYSIRLVTARLRDKRPALIVVGQETYLLADNGDTIERL